MARRKAFGSYTVKGKATPNWKATGRTDALRFAQEQARILRHPVCAYHNGKKIACFTKFGTKAK